ncbi:MAG: tRNA (N6-threonylcarbamoyladenosine(37)-N6)-methyltransferase TrmO [Akkermansiaceae bacterium]|nr:tRNA (N6-threonylcarbamoyladenosine(37)-N6)-methyltransferase TrmO [Akkermansiaceae bacterium]NNM30315.1 tRNA (N6-threonylcarbamoyladenosine(37)-N6)-methyltransferase TrmO [Akkermansiaceae bacterium]
MRTIGVVRTPFPAKFGVPRQAGMVPEAAGEIVLDPEFGPEAVEGLEGFSHLWVVFLFDRVDDGEARTRVRPPRLGGNDKVGVFATRSPFRPNRIGLSAVRLDRVRTGKEGAILAVSGVDLVDGTPLLDIKPYLPYADRVEGATGAFADKPPERMEVAVADAATAGFTALPEAARDLITATLAWDARPAYHEGERVYHTAMAGVEVDWEIRDGTCRILGLRESS